MRSRGAFSDPRALLLSKGKRADGPRDPQAMHLSLCVCATHAGGEAQAARTSETSITKNTRAPLGQSVAATTASALGMGRRAPRPSHWKRRSSKRSPDSK